MAVERRWDPCIAHTGSAVEPFLREYFGDQVRRFLMIAGAGFDPRSAGLASLLVSIGAPVEALLIREERPNPADVLISRANLNADTLKAMFRKAHEVNVAIFGEDGAVVGGRRIVNILNRHNMEGISDVVVDISALSVGTSFPIIRYLVERIGQAEGPQNLHLFVVHDPGLDSEIVPQPCDQPSFVHGFKGRMTLDDAAGAAKLWLPQLATGRRGALSLLHDFILPHDTCPILPFPAKDPRRGDLLCEEYLPELEAGWAVDTRNLVYADESDPLDLYRTILSLDDLRNPVFREVGGSLLVLSPLGSKVMALGALMAALERDLPVAYVEALGYDVRVPTVVHDPFLVHIWLEGDVYPRPRPPLKREGTLSS